MAPRSSSRTGRDRPAARSSAADQRLRAGPAGLASAPGALLPGCRIARGATACHRRIRIAISCCRTASAITATRSAAARKPAGGPLALKRELRELSGQVERQQRKPWRNRGGARRSGARNRASRRGSGTSSRRCSRAQEKDALALDHEQRKLAEEFARAGSRLSVARLELERLRAGRRPRPRAAASTTEPAVIEKEQARFDQEKGARSKRAANSSDLQAHAHSVGEEHAALRAELAGSGRAPPLRESVRVARLGSADRGSSTARAREIWRGSWSAWASSAPGLLADNIELDQRAGATGSSRSARSTRRWTRLADAGDRRPRAIWPRSTNRSKRSASEAQAAQEKRSEIELELVKKQAELKYLDETSRKELNAPLRRSCRGRGDVLDEAGRRRSRAAISGSARADRSAGSGESAGARRIPGSAAALRLPEHAAAGSARFHSRHRKSDSGTRHRIPQALQGSLRGHQRPLPRDVPARCSAAARARCV